jgi:hypothetical protein
MPASFIEVVVVVVPPTRTSGMKRPEARSALMRLRCSLVSANDASTLMPGYAFSKASTSTGRYLAPGGP